jgi:4'-phosphopantetheinyl transferase
MEPPAEISIGKGTIHLWRIRIPEWSEHLIRLEELLSQEESLRINRMGAMPRRAEFIVGRGVLRLLISRYTGMIPCEIILNSGTSGRPYLENPKGKEGLFFSLSHSGDWLLIAFGKEEHFGIDLEFKRDSIDPLAISERFFTRPETLLIRSASASVRKDIFYQVWVRKEACLKAMGIALAGGLKAVEIRGDQGLISLKQMKGASVKWQSFSCKGISLDPDYAAALATVAGIKGVHQFEASISYLLSA